MPISQKDCIQAMREAVGEDVLSEQDAKELFEKVKNKAKARKRARGVPLEQALNDIAGELIGEEKTAAAVDRRNRLLSLLKAKQGAEFRQQFKNWADGREAQYNGVAKTGPEGSREGIHQKERWLAKSLTDRMIATIQEGGAFEAWRKHLHGKDVFRALHALQANAPDRLPENKEAVVIARAIFDFQKQARALLTQYGAWFGNEEGYGILQSYDSKKILREGRTGFFTPPDQSAARRKMQIFAETLNIDEELTYDGVDPDLFWKRVHDNLWTGVHEHDNGQTWDVDRFTSVHGSLAHKVSQQRVIWFKDPDSQFAWHQRYGNGDYVEVTERMLHRAARTAALMETFGPNWRATDDLITSNLKKQARDASIPNSEQIVRELDSPRFAGYQRMLSGEASGAKSVTWAAISTALQDFTMVTKGGSIVLSSFADKAFMVHRMTQLGMSQLDAFASILKGSLPKGPEALAVLRAQHAVFSSQTHNIASRYGWDARSSRPLAGMAQSVMDLQGFTHWNRSNEQTMAMALAQHMGENAGKPMEALPPDLGRNLQAYGLTAAEWDTVRRGAWSFQDGKRVAQLKELGIPADMIGHYAFEGAPRYLTADVVHDLPDSDIASLAEAKGLKPTAGNLTRTRTELEWKIGSFVSDQSDIALNMPDLRTKYWTGKAVTDVPIRVAADIVGIFKTFPITATANLWRSVSQGEGWRGVWQHTLTNPSRLFQTAQLIAMATIAGYMANTIRDWLGGRTRKSLLDDNGVPNWTVWTAALQRGGGLGIMGDYLFTEYDRGYKSLSSTLVGPVLSQLDPAFAALTQGRAAATGDEKAAADLRANLVNTGMANLPFASLWYVKPLLNYFVAWNIKEMLSPGILSRQVEQVEKQGYQTFWMNPATIGGIPMDEPGRKAQAILQELSR